ncbi:hypothetical protein EDC96DRAFT_532139, partial [Choanephora cucurbitarum]
MYTLVMTVSAICLTFNLLVLLRFPVLCRPFESLFSQMFKWNHFPFSMVLTTNKPERPFKKVVFFLYTLYFSQYSRTISPAIL